LIRIEGVEHEEDGEAGARFTVFKQGNAMHAHWGNTVAGPSDARIGPAAARDQLRRARRSPASPARSGVRRPAPPR
jgi:hypothetical protein